MHDKVLFSPTDNAMHEVPRLAAASSLLQASAWSRLHMHGCNMLPVGVPIYTNRLILRCTTLYSMLASSLKQRRD